jgi:hypothetical protein
MMVGVSDVTHSAMFLRCAHHGQGLRQRRFSARTALQYNEHRNQQKPDHAG